MFFIYILITYKKNKKLFCKAYYKDLQKGKELRQQLNKQWLLDGFSLLCRYWNSRLATERQRLLNGFTHHDVVCMFVSWPLLFFFSFFLDK
jgi:tRNA G37 N-methylase Trm5